MSGAALIDRIFLFFGLSLFSRRYACVAPVRGGTYFLCGGKESRQRKPLKPPAPATVHISTYMVNGSG
ncbi:hypothetical protein, partial [Paraburkholderia sp. BR10882]|uniref:hypothetical protein n=1 Tax=unclassified Paraburkholderia TaxID=2615204 RepID=UPI0034CE0D7E